MALYLKLYEDLSGANDESFRLLGKCLARGWHRLQPEEIHRIIDQTVGNSPKK